MSTRSPSSLPGVCTVCELRFKGVPTSSLYVQALTNEKSDLTLDSDQKSYCSLCYGIFLQSEGFFQSIAEKIEQECYQTSDFFLNIALPSSYDLRSSAFQTFALNELSLSAATIIDVKTVLRYLISHFSMSKGSLRFNKQSPVVVSFEISHNESEKDTDFLKANSSFTPKSFYDRHQKKRVHIKESKEANKKAITLMTTEDLKELGFYPPKSVETIPVLASITVSRTPIYIGGRYLKLVRGVSQTPHIVGNTRLAEFSVEELIGEPIATLLQPKSYHLAGSGREDSDVRMLGTGRPFYIQLNNCKNSPLSNLQLKSIENTINSDSKLVNVAALQSVTELDLKIIKSEGGEKNKTYSCLVWISEELSKEKLDMFDTISASPLSIAQKTPVRVLHTRSPLTRQRKIYRMRLSHLKDNFYTLILTTEGGTYIKEFVHGDLGRTTPNFSSIIGAQSYILELDVTDVDLNFPPKK
ncbi:hypothetical protein BB561_004836 [Smittium simulii]|uniref:tRNA pseudouridine(55) synthase n=1 Tax=Smittium simulii TaxID=133385 RepID=A0A2T9YE11_9FUNG|nr:hypothetical protein BB561_004836 [Smittium simulii]